MTRIRDLRQTRWAAWAPGIVVLVAVALFPIFRPPLDGFVDDCIWRSRTW